MRTNTTRRHVLRLAGLSAATLLGACTRGTAKPTASATPEPAGPGDLLQVTTKAGRTVLDTGAGRQLMPPAPALATADLRRIVRAEPDGTSTRLVVCDAANAKTVAAATLRGRLSPRALSSDGSLVALVDGPDSGADTYRPAGRANTTVVVAGTSGELHRYTLPGCVEPEAFSAEEGNLFVLDYLPPTQPDRYRVRSFNLKAGRFNDLLTRDKKVVPAGAEEEMRGEGRQAVFDPVRELLFTLYTHQPDHLHTRDLVNPGARAGKPDVHAFVHTLNIELGWAYCIDLPDPFGRGPSAGHAIVRSPSGTRLNVVDAGSGAIALLDPEQQEVRQVARFAPVTGTSTACYTADARHVLLASGSVITVFDAGSLEVVATWKLPGPAAGIAASNQRIYVGQTGAVLALDPATGAVRKRFPVADLVSAVGLVST